MIKLESDDSNDNPVLMDDDDDAATATARSTTTTTTTISTPTKKVGVASLDELREFLAAAAAFAAAGDKTTTTTKNLVILDVRNPKFDVGSPDARSIAVAPLPTRETRPCARLCTFHTTTTSAITTANNNTKNSMDIPDDVDKDAYIITHCGGGGRALLAKNYLEENGFTNVINGGGPWEKELWRLYGDL